MSEQNEKSAVSNERDSLKSFVERFMHFMNLWTVYTDFLSGKYVPRVSTKDDESITGMSATLMFVLYAFFYSLVEDSPDGVNGFRLWRLRFPEEEATRYHDNGAPAWFATIKRI